MSRFTGLLLALTLTAAGTASFAQNDDQGSAQMSNPPTQSQPAPIERSDYNSNGYNNVVSKLVPGQLLAADHGTASAVAAPGVFLRVGRGGGVRAVTLTNENTELKLDRGVINVSVHSAVKHAQILIDLPGGQTNIIKDGFYTFNANTNTARVLKGEAYAYPGSNTQQKPIKIKENHAVVFNGPDVRAFEFDPFEARADLIPYGPHTEGEGGGPGYYGPYAGYPYYDYGYPYYYGYYPYFGFGYYGGWGGGWGRGGWGGGGFRGGGGFHGGGGRR
jgi:uncharacterized membrane protein YgcG